MDIKNLLLEIRNSKAIITINRPEVRNALDKQTIDEIQKILMYCSELDDIKVIIITGAGEKSFAAGADIGKLKERTLIESLNPGMQGMNDLIENLGKPVIAAVNGFALGGGCELAIACDIRVSSPNSKFGLPELALGLIPGAGGTQRLTQIVGLGKAKEMILTGDIISAEQAEDIGLVNKVVPLEDLLVATEEMADKMITKGPLALRLAKLSINANIGSTNNRGMTVEKLAQSILMMSEDKKEGIDAFLEKRKPIFFGK